jgi:hypothetical protein
MGSVETGTKDGFYALNASSAGAAAIGRSILAICFLRLDPHNFAAYSDRQKNLSMIEA